MQIHLTAAGSPAEIMGTLTRDITRERTAHPEAATALLGARGDIAKAIGAGETLEGDQTPKHYVVSAKVEVTIDITEHESKEAAEKARLPLIGGAPVESTTGAVPAAPIASLTQGRRAADRGVVANPVPEPPK